MVAFLSMADRPRCCHQALCDTDFSPSLIPSCQYGHQCRTVGFTSTVPPLCTRLYTNQMLATLKWLLALVGPICPRVVQMQARPICSAPAILSASCPPVQWGNGVARAEPSSVSSVAPRLSVTGPHSLPYHYSHLTCTAMGSPPVLC